MKWKMEPSIDGIERSSIRVTARLERAAIEIANQYIKRHNLKDFRARLDTMVNMAVDAEINEMADEMKREKSGKRG